MTNQIAIRPIHYASVSGGKDSLYMLKVILENPKKYPLDLVVHFELEIDWPFVKDSVDAMRNMCETLGIPFRAIKPRMTWEEQYRKWGIPTRLGRWCNTSYKLDAKHQLEKWVKQQNCRPVCYIGFCADETRRFKYNVGGWNPEGDQDVCYPLAEEGIVEDRILAWARTQSIFNGWYDIFRRQGCWLCPNLSRLELAYLQKHYPERFETYSRMVREYEVKKAGTAFYFNKPWDEVVADVSTKWRRILDEKENPSQLEMAL